jgi:AcrR family transcriptional regulator
VSGDGDPAANLREHLVVAAASLLAERQVSAVTTRDIARAAGVSDGVLYNYFADKSELLVAGLVRRFETVVATFGVDLPAPGTGTLEDNLVAYLQALYDLSRDSFPMIAGLVGEPGLLVRVIDEIHRPGQGILPFLNRIGEYLYGEQQLGRIRADADLMAAMLLLSGTCGTLAMRSHLMIGFHAVALGEPIDDADAQETLRRAVHALLGGIAAAQRSGLGC